MSVLINGIDLPTSGQIELIIRPHGKIVVIKPRGIGRAEAFQIPNPYGQLITAEMEKARIDQYGYIPIKEG